MNLIKTSILSMIATAIKMLSALVINKAISIFIGPTGLAIIGQFQNILQSMLVASQGGIYSGVVKYSSEYHDLEERRFSLWSTSLKIVVLCSIVVSFFSILFSEEIAFSVFGNKDYNYVFIVLGVTLPLFSINQLLLAIINGIGEIKEYIYINIFQSIFSLFVTTIAIVFYSLDGALIALAVNQSIVLVVLLLRLSKINILEIKFFLGKFNFSVLNKLSKFSFMALTTAVSIPISQLIVRDQIVDKVSWEAAGYWQAIWYISTMYLMVVTTALSTYYLPKLSKTNDVNELKVELKNGFLVIFPFACVSSLIIYFFKDLIISILFTEDFKEMRELFQWQLIGDIVKICSWLLAYLMVAKAKTKLFVFSELSNAVIFVVLSYFLIDKYGVIGVTYAYAINYMIYFIMMVVISFRIINNDSEIRNANKCQ